MVPFSGPAKALTHFPWLEKPGEILKIIANSKLVEKLNAMESRNVLEKIKAMCEA